MLDHPPSPFVHLKFPSKFDINRMRTFRDIRKLRKFGLKGLFSPQSHVFEEFWPPNIIFYHRDPQKALPHAETRVVGHKWSWSVFCWELEVRARIQKGKNPKGTENALPAQTPFPSSPRQLNFACGVVSQTSFLVSSFIKIGWKMWELWGSKFRPSHWLGTSLIQQLVATAQAVISRQPTYLPLCWYPFYKVGLSRAAHCSCPCAQWANGYQKHYNISINVLLVWGHYVIWEPKTIRNVSLGRLHVGLPMMTL